MYSIPLEELDVILARFFLSVRKQDGEEYEPSSLSNMQSSFMRHLSANGYTWNLHTDPKFSQHRDVINAKLLRQQGKGLQPNKSEAFSDDDIELLYKKSFLVQVCNCYINIAAMIVNHCLIGNPDAMIAPLWLNFATHFGTRGRQEHYSLLWRDVELKLTSNCHEYL